MAFVGYGFEWMMRHRQEYDRLAARGEQTPHAGGFWTLHAIGGRDTPVEIPDALLQQHVLICGSTGCGKSKLLELLALQAIARGDATVIVDPKGDQALLNDVVTLTRRLGRPFRFFGLPCPNKSVRYNPLASFSHAGELADRIAQLLPSSGESVAFRNFAWEVVYTVARAMIRAGVPMTIDTLARYVAHPLPLAHLLLPKLAKYPAEQAIKAYEASNVERIEPLDALIALLRHPADHFQKMVSSLKPVLAKLGSHRDLLSSNELAWDQVVERKEVAYLFLGSMQGCDTAHAVAKLALLDFQTFVGRRYAEGARGRVSLFVDEFAEVVTPEFISLLNKCRGAGVSITAATQTVSDLEAILGSTPRAMQVLGNANTIVQFRTNDGRDAELFSAACGAVPAPVVEEGQSYEPALFSSGSKWVDDFRAVFSYRESLKECQVVPPYAVLQLPNLHAFAKVGARVFKIVVPVVENRSPERFEEKLA